MNLFAISFGALVSTIWTRTYLSHQSLYSLQKRLRINSDTGYGSRNSGDYERNCSTIEVSSHMSHVADCTTARRVPRSGSVWADQEKFCGSLLSGPNRIPVLPQSVSHINYGSVVIPGPERRLRFQRSRYSGNTAENNSKCIDTCICVGDLASTSIG